MAKRIFAAGATSQTIDLFIQDSSVGTGAGLSGLVFNTAGLTAYYRNTATGSATQITLATQTVGGAYSSGGFVEIDATNMKGMYRLDLPNGVFTSAPFSVIYLQGATNMVPCIAELQIENTSAALFGVNVVSVAGTAQTARDLGASVLLSSGTGTGQLDFTSGVVKSNVTQLLGTSWLTPGTAGTPDVNVKLWNGLTTVALPLVPTTAGRTLDVSAGGEAGIDWANIGSPTTAVTFGNITYGNISTSGTTTYTGNVVYSDGITISAPSTTNRSGLDIAGNGSGQGINSIGGSSGAGAIFKGGSSSGSGFRVLTQAGNSVAFDIQSDGSGSAFKTTAGTTGIGMNINGGLAAGRAADFVSNGTDAVRMAAGTGGIGLNISGNGNDGLKISSNNGHGVEITANGTSHHGVTITGGSAGVSDGLKCVAGTGGVDIRGNITGGLTGEVTGNLSGSVGSVVGLTASNLDTTVSSRLAPTVASRTLDVSATGEAGVDWGNVGGQSTSVNLSATTTNLVNTVTTYTGNTPQTGDSFTRIGATGSGLTSITSKTDLIPAVPASTTNITAGTITTVTNLTNAPTAGDFTAVMKTSLNAATPASVAGAVGSVTGNVGGNVVGSVGSVTGLTASNLDATVSSRLASASYTAPDNTGISDIKTQTDKLSFTVANQIDSNIHYVNDIQVDGSGTTLDPWGPV